MSQLMGDGYCTANDDSDGDVDISEESPSANGNHLSAKMTEFHATRTANRAPSTLRQYNRILNRLRRSEAKRINWAGDPLQILIENMETEIIIEYIVTESTFQAGQKKGLKIQDIRVRVRH